MLVLEGVQSGYGSSQVLFDIALAVEAGSITTLLGRNGMGKTTTIRTIMGLLPLKGGSIVLDGKVMNGSAPEIMAQAGIGVVPEGRQVFPTLTVYENLVATAANRRNVPSPWTVERAFALFPRLDERRNQLGSTLSGGEQQMVTICRALLTNPRLLILDEATEGLAPLIRAEIWKCLGFLNAEGLAILIVDKNLSILRTLGHRHHVVEKGRTVWSGGKQDFERDGEHLRRLLGV